MIKYNLICKNRHEFESWFSHSKEFDKLNKKKLLKCIYCDSNKINKSIMSPSIMQSKKSLNLNSTTNQELYKTKLELLKLRNFVEKNLKFVGNQLANKIREVYYNDSKKNNFYGTTTKEEEKELKEEGIDLVSIPWVEKNN